MNLQMDMNKGLLWFGPVTVLAFVIVLTVMYGWVGEMKTLGPEPPEKPDLNLTAQMQVPPPSATGGQMGQLVHHGQFPTGIGQSQIKLINAPGSRIPMGIGQGEIRLIAGKQAQPYMGIALGAVDPAVANELKLPPDTGAYVTAVVDTSPAQKVGIRKGDVLLRCDHKNVSSPQQVGLILAGKKAGKVVKLVVNRNGRKKSFHVKLENAPMGISPGVIKEPVWMGADIQDVDMVMKIRFNLPDNRGVIISNVAPNSPAKAAGLNPGDVIKQFNARPVKDVTHLQDMILKSKPNEIVPLTILRGGMEQSLNVSLVQHTPAGATRLPFIGPADIAIEGSWIGMDVTELSADDAAAFGLPAGTRGILVNDVESPPATTVGFQTGDVIVGVNGAPTPDMKQFETATRKQSSAVVDVIRGNRHFFISVPPPGFTQQGTNVNTRPKQQIMQVAMAQPLGGRLGIFSSGPHLNAFVAGDTGTLPYLILVDPSRNTYASLGPESLGNLPDVIRQQQVTSLVCSSISPATANALTAQGVNIYQGAATTTVIDAIRMVQAQGG
ncbi:MAG: PDZ domain-containing protein [Desulfobacterales bacterium]